MLPARNASPAAAVLLSGGLDSAVLLADEATRGVVQPIYVSVGLAWESAERAVVDALLQALAVSPLAASLRPLVQLTVAMDDVYPVNHWARTGRAPGYSTPDEDVYLHGRNIVLLGKAGVYCATLGIPRIVLGTLGHNPFPDATPAFRAAMAAALSLGLAHTITVDAPFADLNKIAVIKRGGELAVPFALTLSCMQPPPQSGGGLALHCGACSKCRERHDAFIDAGIADPTAYDDRRFVGQGRSSASPPADHSSRPPT